MTDTQAAQTNGNFKGPMATPINLQLLLDTYGEEDLKEIFLLFREETKQLLEKLIQALKEKDKNTTQALAHQMKGLSAVITALDMEGLCCIIEQGLKQGDWDVAQEAGINLESSFHGVLTVIDEYLATHNSI